jgi:predicted RNA-binding Zn-ribbon protein involved in translation (DUF1610 family)
MSASKKVKIKCTCCGKEFETWTYIGDRAPYDFMCPDCQKNEWWWYCTRMLKLEKFRCVKCGWKLKKKDSPRSDENLLWFKCKCCGYEFALWFPEPY